jgi:spermidine/putrescine transport system ATP-binding protein
MNQGRLEQVGTPAEIYDRPQSAFVADFIGDTNLLTGRIETRLATQPDAQLHIHTSNGLKLQAAAADLASTVQDVVVSVRPEAIALAAHPPSDRDGPTNGPINCFEGRLCNQMYLGTHVQYLVELNSGDRIRVHRPTASRDPLGAGSGDAVYVYWSAQDSLALAA